MATVQGTRGVATRAPALFLSHGGGPSFFLSGGMFSDMDKDSRFAAFLRGVREDVLGQDIVAGLKGLVVVSAHWEGRGTFLVSDAEQPDLLFDYYGFPESAYKLTYPARGDPALAQRVAALLAGASLPTACDRSHGYDHGVFVPLKLVFPDADVPIVQVSLHGSLDPEIHLRAGEALAPLLDEGVSVIGSGFATHNLSEMRNPGEPTPKWVEEWERDLTAACTEGDAGRRRERLLAMCSHPHFRRAHPREEHFVPLMVAAGAGLPGGGRDPAARPPERIFNAFVNGTGCAASYSWY